MSFLEKFSADDREFLISMPYRVGLWVSSCDDTGGADADEKELEALRMTLLGLASEGMFESAFVHEVIAASSAAQSSWRSWGMNLKDIPGDCKRAVAMIQGALPQRDVDAYKRILMHIGVEVAKAFREYDAHEPLLNRLIRWISIGVDRILGAVQGEKYVSSDLLNISYSEDIALNELATALRGEVDDIAEKARIVTHS